MTFWQRSGGQLALCILSVIGIGVSIYLTLEHYSAAALYCPVVGIIDCSSVLKSPYAFVPGTELPISLPGLFWFLVVGILAIGAWLKPQQQFWRTAQVIWSILGVFTALYLVYVELVILRQICLWCTILHFLILIVLILAFLFRHPYEEYLDDEDLPIEEA